MALAARLGGPACSPTSAMSQILTDEDFASLEPEIVPEAGIDLSLIDQNLRMTRGNASWRTMTWINVVGAACARMEANHAES